MTGYPLPRRQLAEVVRSVLAMQPRSFASDALRAVSTLKPPASYDATDHIPDRGPFLVVHNHYNAPGYGAWWNVLAITAAIAQRRAAGADREVHWVMTAAIRGGDNGWLTRAIARGTERGLRRVAHVYGFINMPPMPPRPEEAAERARSVLQTIRMARRLAKVGGMIGLTPEGQDHPGGFGPPPPGAGEFIALLVEAGMPVLPVGITQAREELRVRFGPVFAPRVPPRKDNRDAIVAEQVMGAIGRCLEYLGR